MALYLGVASRAHARWGFDHAGAIARRRWARPGSARPAGRPHCSSLPAHPMFRPVPAPPCPGRPHDRFDSIPRPHQIPAASPPSLSPIAAVVLLSAQCYTRLALKVGSVGFSRDTVRGGGHPTGVTSDRSGTKRCWNCQDAYVPSTVSQRWCSPACQKQAARDRGRGEQTAAHYRCPACCRSLTGRRSHATYCSPLCRWRAHWFLARTGDPTSAYLVHCATCAMEFPARRADARYCGDRCRKRAQRERVAGERS